MQHRLKPQSLIRLPLAAAHIYSSIKNLHFLITEEKYDYAKKLKQTIHELQKAGEKLGKYEVEKRQAVENEDYDKAKLKKLKIDEYRLQVYKDLNVNSFLDVS